jgi:hypothetical protein
MAVELRGVAVDVETVAMIVSPVASRNEPEAKTGSGWLAYCPEYLPRIRNWIKVMASTKTSRIQA